MPHRNGFEVLAAVRKRFPSLRVLVVTMHLDRKVANLAFRTGAHGFVPKESSARELNVAITQVLEGNKYLSPRVSRRGYRDANVDVNPALDRLTPRQKEILRLLGRGKSSPAIAAELDVSVRTVEFHRAGIRRALGITSEWGLMRFAIMADLGSGAERR